MTAVQTSYDLAPAAGLPGMRAKYNPGAFAATMIALSALVPGNVYFRGRASAGSAGEIGPVTAATADADAIVATLGSTTGIQTLTGASLDGVVGDDEMFPPRNVTMTFSNHSDWDATTAVITGLDENGVSTSESLSIPNGGNAAVTGSTKFKSIVSVVIPAQTGTGGTATVGFGALLGAVDHLVAGIVERDATRTAVNYAADELVPVGRVGEYFATSEDAVTEGAPVWVRMVVSGAEVLGALRATPDANDCVRLKNARWSSANAAGLSRLELNLPAG